MAQPIPIGITNFKKLRSGHYYYVDKTMLIADVVRTGAEVILLPRPRRFGKTMNLSMLYHFFNNAEEHNRALFEGLAVTEHADVMDHCGAYPTVFLSLKDLKSNDFEEFKSGMARLLSKLFVEHGETALQARPEGLEKHDFEAVREGTASVTALQSSLALLTNLLHKATGKPAILLIDEYDTPIHAGYQHGYYSGIIGFVP